MASNTISPSSSLEPGTWTRAPLRSCLDFSLEVDMTRTYSHFNIADWHFAAVLAVTCDCQTLWDPITQIRVRNQLASESLTGLTPHIGSIKFPLITWTILVREVTRLNSANDPSLSPPQKGIFRRFWSCYHFGRLGQQELWCVRQRPLKTSES